MSTLLVIGGALGFVSGLTSASTGLAGGTILLAGFSVFLSPAAALLHHACAQGGMNLIRLGAFRKAVQWRAALTFLPAGVIGVVLAAPIVEHIPREVFLAVVVGVIASAAFRREAVADRPSSSRLVFAAFFSGALGTLAGSNGPLLSSVLIRCGITGEKHIATKAAVQTVIHGTKVVALIALGVSTLDATLVAIVLTGGAVGTWFGKALLHRLPEHRRGYAARAALAVIACVLSVEIVSAVVVRVGV